jgi:hypothetical protein
MGAHDRFLALRNHTRKWAQQESGRLIEGRQLAE